MEPDDRDPHLSQISTQWTLVFQAHNDLPEQAAAQLALMARYAGAVHRYLLASVRDPDLAAELDQEFALRFLRGDFHRADPSRGRFRDFIKRAVRNLMLDYQRRTRARPRPLGEAPEPADPDVGPAAEEFDRHFTESWRKDLLARAWDALADLQRRTDQPYHTVLRFRVENPELHSPEMAARLSQQLGRPITPGGLRQALQRARDKFVGFLLDEVRASLKAPTPDTVEDELIELGLIEYCRPALKRLADGAR